MVTDYRRKIGWLEIVAAGAVIYGLIWLELHVPGWKFVVLFWGIVLWLAFAALRLVVALYRLFK
jgi:hypothetical protein